MSVYARRSSELKVAYTYPTHHARVRSTLRSDPESHEGKPHSISESVEVQIWDTRWSATSGDTQRCSGAARTGSEVVLMKVDTTAMKPGTSSKRSHPTKPAPSEHCSHSRAPRTESHHADAFACGARLHADCRRNSEANAAPALASKSGLAHEV